MDYENVVPILSKISNINFDITPHLEIIKFGSHRVYYIETYLDEFLVKKEGFIPSTVRKLVFVIIKMD